MKKAMYGILGLMMAASAYGAEGTLAGSQTTLTGNVTITAAADTTRIVFADESGQEEKSSIDLPVLSDISLDGITSGNALNEIFDNRGTTKVKIMKKNSSGELSALETNDGSNIKLKITRGGTDVGSAILISKFVNNGASYGVFTKDNGTVVGTGRSMELRVNGGSAITEPMSFKYRWAPQQVDAAAAEGNWTVAQDTKVVLEIGA